MAAQTKSRNKSKHRNVSSGAMQLVRVIKANGEPKLELRQRLNMTRETFGRLVNVSVRAIAEAERTGQSRDEDGVDIVAARVLDPDGDLRTRQRPAILNAVVEAGAVIVGDGRLERRRGFTRGEANLDGAAGFVGVCGCAREREKKRNSDGRAHH